MDDKTIKLIAKIADSVLPVIRDRIMLDFKSLGSDPAYKDVFHFSVGISNTVRTHIYSFIEEEVPNA